DFRRRFGALVLGIWRRGGFVPMELSQIRLRTGDVLVLQGDNEALARVRADQSLLLTPFHGESRPRRRAILAAAIMLATVLVAAFNLLSLALAAFAGATAMVLTRCLTSRQ